MPAFIYQMMATMIVGKGGDDNERDKWHEVQ